MSPDANVELRSEEVQPEELFKPSSWCNSWGKRAFDLICASVGLVLCSPVMLVIALVVKASSRGTVLFRHTRLGRGGKPFQILKFRTMVHLPGSGPEVTRSGDARVTGVGRILRQWKLDELPQLINVARGDMSLVGPRPDVPKYLLSLSSSLKPILQLRPGITSLASLCYRNEEEVLAQVKAEELESYYVQVLLPEKVRIDLEYARQATFLTDLKCLWGTITAVMG